MARSIMVGDVVTSVFPDETQKMTVVDVEVEGADPRVYLRWFIGSKLHTGVKRESELALVEPSERSRIVALYGAKRTGKAAK